MKTKAYSYRRFSSSRQDGESSLSRQLKMSQEYADRHGLSLDMSLSLDDEAVSGFKGANLTDGNLGAFLKAINDGIVEKGSYLLVESLDRLSRDRVPNALRLFLEILDYDITIVTLIDGMVFANDSLDANQLLMSIFIMSRAHEESQTKSVRLRKTWQRKRERSDEIKLTKWAPKWLELSADRTEFIAIPERVQTIESVFQWCIDGYGTSLIIKKLEEQGVQPWDWKDKELRGINVPKKWYPSYIQRLFKNRALLGEHEYHNPDDPTESVVMEDYFPRVISEEMFYKAQAARASRDINRGNRGAGRKGQLLTNLFSGIAYCGYSVDSGGDVYRCEGDNEKMFLVNKGKPYKYLQCSRIKDGNSGCLLCKKMWRYDWFESSFLTFIDDIDVSDISGVDLSVRSKLAECKTRCDDWEAKLSGAQAQLSKYAEAADRASEISSTIIEKLAKWESAVEDAQKELDVARDKLRSVEAEFNDTEVQAQNLNTLVEQMKGMKGEELFNVRLQFSNVLKKYIDHILVFPSGYNLERTEEYYQHFQDLMLEHAENESEEAEVIQTVNELRRLHQNSRDKNTNPFFLVVYKDGKATIVTPDPSDPQKIFTYVSGSEDQIKEIDAAFLHD